MKSLHSYFKRTAETGECLVDSDEVRQIINSNPHSAREVAGLDHVLPLHAALDTFDSTPLEVVKIIIDAYPEAVSIPDVDGLLPLAYACDNGVGSPILQMLLKEYPGSIHYLDDEGWTPLHHACYPDESVTVQRRVEMVISLMKHASWLAAAGRQRPLNCAKRKFSSSIVEQEDNVLPSPRKKPKA